MYAVLLPITFRSCLSIFEGTFRSAVNNNVGSSNSDKNIQRIAHAIYFDCVKDRWTHVHSLSLSYFIVQFYHWVDELCQIKWIIDMYICLAGTSNNGITNIWIFTSERGSNQDNPISQNSLHTLKNAEGNLDESQNWRNNCVKGITDVLMMTIWRRRQRSS